MTTLGARLRAARLAAGLTQSDLAGDGISPSFVSRIESDDRQPGTEALRLFAQRLGVSPDWLRRGTGSAPFVAVRDLRRQAQADLTSGEPAIARERLEGLDLNTVPVQDRASTAVLLSHAQERCGDFEAARAGLEPLWRDAVAQQRPVDALTLARGLLYLDIVSGRSEVALDVGRTTQRVIAGHEVDPDEKVRLGATMGWARLERGDRFSVRVEAFRLHAEAMMSGSDAGRAVALWNLSTVEEALGRASWARRYAHDAIALMPDGPSSRDRDYFRARESYGSTLMMGGDSAAAREAVEQFEIARSGLDIVGGPDDLAELDVHQSRAHLILGQVDAAERWAESALDRVGLPSPVDRVRAVLALADVQLARGRRAAAEAMCRRARELVDDVARARDVSLLLRAIGDRLLACGRADLAAAAFSRALAVAGIRPAPVRPAAEGRRTA